MGIEYLKSEYSESIYIYTKSTKHTSDFKDRIKNNMYFPFLNVSNVENILIILFRHYAVKVNFTYFFLEFTVL